MAPPAGTLRVGRYFLTLLAVLAVLYLIVFWPGQSHTPKLGLDLRGGAQVVLQAKTLEGQTPPKNSMQQARDIIEQRVNGLGVSNAEVVIQGTDQIVISVPGKRADDLQNIGKAAQLSLRPIVMPPYVPSSPSQVAPPTTGSPTPTSTPTGTPAATPTASHSAQADSVKPLAAAATSAKAKASTTPTHAAASATPTPTASPTSPAAATKLVADPFKDLGFALPKSEAEFDKLSSTQRSQLQQALANLDCSADHVDDPTKPYAACDQQGIKYLMAPTLIKGTQIKTAAAEAPNFTGGGSAQWTVRLTLKPSAQSIWADYTSKNHSNSGGNPPSVTTCSSSGTPCAQWVAFTLDNNVISVPHNEATINGADTSITGSFTESTATTLANQLKYGALPVNFTTLTQQTVSATLGTDQLKAGMLAGGIGLALVVLYSLLYYRGLGLVTIASLLVSGALVYACLVILGHQIGFTLTLAGIAGFIVAVGITADSFVVFFERIKDEVHEGRSMRVAVPRAWIRARRTILSADIVSFLAAAVLYYFASGDVRGFAFTLGLSTILDLVVVFLFTHPLVSLLSRSKTFGSPRFTGLNAMREGGIVPDEPVSASPAVPRRARSTSSRRSAAGAVAVLDEPQAPASEPASEPAPEVETVSDVSADVEPETSADKETEPKPRTRTGPPQGSAAERAAARRARLKAEKGEN